MSSGRSPNPNPNPQQVFGLFSKSIGHNITNSFNMTPKKKKKKKMEISSKEEDILNDIPIGSKTARPLR